MEIAKLGEFGLIDHLTKDIKPVNESTRYGVGDDCAVLHYPESEVLVTTDMLMEGIHFDLTYITMQELGYKAAMVNIAFYDGLRRACEKWSVDVVGGDTTASYTGLAISITCIGEAKKEDIVYRNGANETDLICVTGDLGAAYMGLQLLEREKSVFYQQVDAMNKKLQEAHKAGNTKLVEHLQQEARKLNDFQPDFAGKEYLLQRQLKPEARGDVINLLRENNIHPTAMMDISDGLSSELLHICKQSHCGCRVYEKNIPIDYQTAVMAEELNMNVTTCAMNGGDDYELLFTCPIGDHDKLDALESKGIKQIGYITKEELGVRLISRDNKEFDITAQGWNALKE